MKERLCRVVERGIYCLLAMVENTWAHEVTVYSACSRSGLRNKEWTNMDHFDSGKVAADLQAFYLSL